MNTKFSNSISQNVFILKDKEDRSMLLAILPFLLLQEKTSGESEGITVM